MITTFIKRFMSRRINCEGEKVTPICTYTPHDNIETRLGSLGYQVTPRRLQNAFNTNVQCWIPPIVFGWVDTIGSDCEQILKYCSLRISCQNTYWSEWSLIGGKFWIEFLNYLFTKFVKNSSKKLSARIFWALLWWI